MGMMMAGCGVLMLIQAKFNPLGENEQFKEMQEVAHEARVLAEANEDFLQMKNKILAGDVEGAVAAGKKTAAVAMKDPDEFKKNVKHNPMLAGQDGIVEST